MQTLISSQKSKKLEARIKAVASRISKAIQEKQPLLIRHDNDPDGWTAAFAIENAVKPLLKKELGERASFYYTRIACKASFYSVEDATKDINQSLHFQERFNRALPLVVILDNGSTETDRLGIAQLRGFGFDVVVIDHHDPQGKGTDDLLQAHLNPHLEGLPYNYCTGMLAVEVAYQINPQAKDLHYLAAIAGYADKSELPEWETHVKKSKVSLEHIKELSEVFKYILTMNRIEPEHYLRAYLTDENVQKALNTLFLPVIETSKEEALLAIKKFMITEERKGYTLQIIELGKVLLSGNYPRNRGIIGLTHMQKETPRVSMGIGEEFITVRADQVPWFDTNKLIKHLQQALPWAGIEGGGHAPAGAFHFRISAKPDVIKAVKAWLR